MLNLLFVRHKTGSPLTGKGTVDPPKKVNYVISTTPDRMGTVFGFIWNSYRFFFIICLRGIVNLSQIGLRQGVERPP